VTNAAMDCRRACAIAHTKSAGDMYNRTPLTAAGSPSPLVIALSSRPSAIVFLLTRLEVLLGSHAKIASFLPAFHSCFPNLHTSLRCSSLGPGH
jgi:hypothetical protein